MEHFFCKFDLVNTCRVFKTIAIVYKSCISDMFMRTYVKLSADLCNYNIGTFLLSENGGFFFSKMGR